MLKAVLQVIASIRADRDYQRALQDNVALMERELSGDPTLTGPYRQWRRDPNSLTGVRWEYRPDSAKGRKARRTHNKDGIRIVSYEHTVFARLVEMEKIAAADEALRGGDFGKAVALVKWDDSATIAVFETMTEGDALPALRARAFIVRHRALNSRNDFHDRTLVRIGKEAIAGLAKYGLLAECSEAVRHLQVLSYSGLLDRSAQPHDFFVQAAADASPAGTVLLCAAYQGSDCSETVWSKTPHVQRLSIVNRMLDHPELESKAAAALIRQTGEKCIGHALPGYAVFVERLIQHAATQNGIAASSQREALNVLAGIDFAQKELVPLGEAYYAMLDAEITQGADHIYDLPAFKNYQDMTGMIARRNAWRYAAERNRVQLTLGDLIPNESCGMAGARIRHQVADVIYGHLTGHGGDMNEGARSEARDAVIKYSQAVLDDPDVPNDSMEAQNARLRLDTLEAPGRREAAALPSPERTHGAPAPATPV